MRRPSRRISRLLGFTVVPVSLVATGLFVTASSYSVFNAQTSNAANSWSAGTISLTDDDSSGAMFSVTNIKPGQQGERCIVVSYTGSSANVASTVKLYGGTYVPSTPNDIGTRIQLTVDQGTGTGTFAGSSGGLNGSCSTFSPLGTGASVYSGTLASFASGNTSFGTVTTTNPWATAGTGSAETRIYRIKWSMLDGGPATDNLYQNKQAKVDFIWEAQTS
jgi:hypothetical protein